MWMVHAFHLVLGVLVSGQDLGPNCTECVSSKALPCSGSISQTLVDNALTYLSGTSLDQDVAFTAITSDMEFKMASGFYVFVYEFDGPCVAHGARSDFVNLTLPEIVTLISNPTDGTVVDTALQAGAEGGGGWVGYSWTNSADTAPIRKIAYSAKLTKWGKDYYVGAGFNDIAEPLDSTCTSAGAAACAEMNAVSIMGSLMASFLVVESGSDMVAIFNQITDQTGFRTDNGFYAFVYRYDGNCEAHGANSAFVGLTLPGIVTSINNPTDGQVVDNALQAGAEAGGDWVVYDWTNIVNEDPYQKIAYVRKFTMAGTNYYYGVGYNQVCLNDQAPEQVVQVCAGGPAEPQCPADGADGADGSPANGSDSITNTTAVEPSGQASDASTGRTPSSSIMFCFFAMSVLF